MPELMLPRDLNGREIFTDESRMNDLLSSIEQTARSVVVTVDTDKGRRATASLARKVASSKVYLDNLGKELASDWRRQVKIVEGQRRTMRDRLDTLKTEIRAPLTAWEEEERQREIAAEEAARAATESEELQIAQEAPAPEIEEQEQPPVIAEQEELEITGEPESINEGTGSQVESEESFAEPGLDVARNNEELEQKIAKIVEEDKPNKELMMQQARTSMQIYGLSETQAATIVFAISVQQIPHVRFVF